MAKSKHFRSKAELENRILELDREVLELRKRNITAREVVEWNIETADALLRAAQSLLDGGCVPDAPEATGKA